MDSTYFLIKYFGKLYYVCPKCRTADTSDWETFRRSHPHLGAFSVSKKSILLTYLAQENVKCPLQDKIMVIIMIKIMVKSLFQDQMVTKCLLHRQNNSENYGRKGHTLMYEPIRPKILRYSGAEPVGISTVPEVIEIPSSPEVIEIPSSPEVMDDIPSHLRSLTMKSLTMKRQRCYIMKLILHCLRI